VDVLSFSHFCFYQVLPVGLGQVDQKVKPDELAFQDQAEILDFKVLQGHLVTLVSLDLLDHKVLVVQ